ncbi:MAG TPA: sigma 54-interacting transcriptional regulator [Vicinamibacterales bacterium]|nr:sigma 54-interacting transcriptional regulator [Vicinamibacterales bacterium]
MTPLADAAFQLAADASPNAILVYDEAGTILFANEKVKAVFGYTPDALIGQSVNVLVPGFPGPVGRETRGRHEDGSAVPVEIGLTSASHEGRRVLVASILDVSGRHALERQRDRLAIENTHLRSEVKALQLPRALVAESPAARRVVSLLEPVAATNATVLLLGETGSGKDVVAQAIHDMSKRHARPMVRVNCGAIPTALIESELFGRERGAYTGALSKQIGRFEAADGSTIFLDEIAELPLESQVKLLRVLQDKVIERLGSTQSVKIDVRIIAATNRDLERAIEERTFREDLYYRLNVYPITVPPLRERREDIPLLVWTFIDEFSKSFGKTITSIARESLTALEHYSWPGNVRELRNVVERAMIVATGPRLVFEPPRAATPGRTRTTRLSEMETEHIRNVLDACAWRVRGNGGAAERLGMKPTTLESRMAKLGIRRASRGARQP